MSIIKRIIATSLCVSFASAGLLDKVTDKITDKVEGKINGYFGGNILEGSSKERLDIAMNKLESSISQSDLQKLQDMSGIPFQIQCTQNNNSSTSSTTNNEVKSDPCSKLSRYNNSSLVQSFNSISNAVTNGIDINGCTVKNNFLDEYKNKSLESLCRNAITPEKKITIGTRVTQVNATKNKTLTSEKSYDINNTKPLGERIKYGNTTLKSMENNYLPKNKILNKIEAGGLNALYKPGKFKLYEDCVKVALSKNQNPDLICKGNFYKLPDDRIKYEEEIEKSATIDLRDSTINLSNEIDGYIEMKKNASLSTCSSGSSTTCSDSTHISSQNNVSQMYSAKKKSLKSNVEEEMSNYLEFIKEANMPNFRINYPTQDVLEGIDPSKQSDFVIKVKKQMHQEALLANSIHTLTNLKKELIDLSFERIETNSKIFYVNNAIAEAQAIMNSGLVK